jgi:hypothetical protein
MARCPANLFQDQPLYCEQVPLRVYELVTLLVVCFQLSDDCLCSNNFLIHDSSSRWRPVCASFVYLLKPYLRYSTR